jgi:hypothetical protein
MSQVIVMRPSLKNQRGAKKYNDMPQCFREKRTSQNQKQQTERNIKIMAHINKMETKGIIQSMKEEVGSKNDK